MFVQGIDYVALATRPETRASIEAAMRGAIAASRGIKEEDVELEPASGPAIVKAKIIVAPGTFGDVFADLKSCQKELCDNAKQRVLAIPSVGAIVNGDVGVVVRALEGAPRLPPSSPLPPSTTIPPSSTAALAAAAGLQPADDWQLHALPSLRPEAQEDLGSPGSGSTPATRVQHDKSVIISENYGSLADFAMASPSAAGAWQKSRSSMSLEQRGRSQEMLMKHRGSNVSMMSMESRMSSPMSPFKGSTLGRARMLEALARDFPEYYATEGEACAFVPPINALDPGWRPPNDALDSELDSGEGNVKEVYVSGPAGHSCTCQLRAGSTLEELKAMLFVSSGVPEDGQELFHGDQELTSSGQLRDLLQSKGGLELRLTGQGEADAAGAEGASCSGESSEDDSVANPPKQLPKWLKVELKGKTSDADSDSGSGLSASESGSGFSDVSDDD